MFKGLGITDNAVMREDKEYKAFLKKISLNIRKYRKKRSLTQEDMEDYGFSYKHYQRLESGSYSMNLYTLHRLAKALKINVNRLFS